MSGMEATDEELANEVSNATNEQEQKAIWDSLILKLSERNDLLSPSTSSQSYSYQEPESEDRCTDESDFEELEGRAIQGRNISRLPPRKKPQAFFNSDYLYKRKAERAALRRALAEQEKAKNAAKKKKSN